MFIALGITLLAFLISYYLSEKKFKTKKLHNILLGTGMFSACSTIALMAAIAGSYAK